jgi:hypothetical protein
MWSLTGGAYLLKRDSLIKMGIDISELDDSMKRLRLSLIKSHLGVRSSKNRRESNALCDRETARTEMFPGKHRG